MPRLPQVGGDSEQWGAILNEFLLVSHTTTGSVKAGSISESQLSSAVKNKLNGVGGATNLATTTSSTTLTVTSDTGTDAVLPAATGSVAGVMTAADKTKLSGISSGAQVNTVTSVAGRTGDITLTKSDVDLANVDNTSDANKPISTATQTALDGKAATGHSHTVSLDNLSDVTITSPSVGEVIKYNGSGWVNDTDATSGGAGATNLSVSTSATTVTVASDTGTDAVLPAASGSAAGVLTAADKTKLDSIASSATANATDAQLRDRSMHTGTQTASTISDFATSARSATAVVTTNSQSGTAYTLVLGDLGLVVETTNSSAVTLTVPLNSAVAFPVGSTVAIRQYGAGQVSVAATGGVTVLSRGSAFKLGGQYAEALLTKRATDEWILSGDLTT